MVGENVSPKELQMTRMYDAPIEKLWKAWTDQDVVRKWWGPRGVTNPVCEVDARPGGKINIVMRAGKELGSFSGQEWPMSGIFKEVVPMKKLVFTSQALDDVKDIVVEAEVTVHFEDLGGKTKVIVNIRVTKAGPKSEFALRGMEAGWNQQMDKLSEEMEG